MRRPRASAASRSVPTRPSRSWSTRRITCDCRSSVRACSPQFGYLTACPTNVGTGLRITVMMHLPAAVLSKQMDKVLQSLQRLNYTVRGFYGEGTQPLGDFYQVSNQITL